MKIPGASNGNALLNSVMAQQSTSDSYAQRSLHGQRVGMNLQKSETGKAVNSMLKTKAKEDAELIEENTKKTLEKKEELEKAEAQRMANKQGATDISIPRSTSQGDTVEISAEALEILKGMSTTPSQISTPTTQPAPAPSAPAQGSSSEGKNSDNTTEQAAEGSKTE